MHFRWSQTAITKIAWVKFWKVTSWAANFWEQTLVNSFKPVDWGAG